MSWLARTRRLRLEPDAITFSAALSACEKGVEWVRALNLLEEMLQQRVAPTAVTQGAAVAACEKGRQWQKAQALLGRVGLTVVLCNSMMAACDKGGRWEEALRLLGQMQQASQLRPNAMVYTSLASSCGRAGRWEQAVTFAREALRRDLEGRGDPTAADEPRGRQAAVSFVTAVTACGGALQWSRAVRLVEEMRSTRGIGLQAVACEAAIGACAKASVRVPALGLLREVRAWSPGFLLEHLPAETAGAQTP